MPVPQTREEREERAKFLREKRGANATAADRYRQRQMLMVREANDLVNSLDRAATDERAAALTQALEDLPERGAAQPRRVLEAALEKSPVAEPVPTPEPAKPENPFANFALENAPLTDEERAEEKARLTDFFERKRLDPTATWDAAPQPDADEAGFQAFMAELRAEQGVTPT